MDTEYLDIKTVREMQSRRSGASAAFTRSLARRHVWRTCPLISTRSISLPSLLNRNSGLEYRPPTMREIKRISASSRQSRRMMKMDAERDRVFRDFRYYFYRGRVSVRYGVIKRGRSSEIPANGLLSRQWISSPRFMRRAQIEISSAIRDGKYEGGSCTELSLEKCRIPRCGKLDWRDTDVVPAELAALFCSEVQALSHNERANRSITRYGCRNDGCRMDKKLWSWCLELSTRVEIYLMRKFRSLRRVCVCVLGR